MFQFQTGSIRRDARTVTNNIFRAFQFQTGSIRRNLRVIIAQGVRRGFNSKLVRLEETLHLDIDPELMVSIPNWFD